MASKAPWLDVEAPATLEILELATLSWSIDGSQTGSGRCGEVTHVARDVVLGQLGVPARHATDPTNRLWGVADTCTGVERQPSFADLPAACNAPIRLALAPLGVTNPLPFRGQFEVARPIESMARIGGGRLAFSLDQPSKPIKANIREFWLDVHEVTTASLEECQRAGYCGGETFSEPVKLRYAHEAKSTPALVTWENAYSYCSWVGKRLPTVEEWLWAATGRGEGRWLPWGEAFVTCDHEAAVDPASKDPRCLDYEADPVGARPKGESRDGLANMAGNYPEVTWDPASMRGERETTTEDSQPDPREVSRAIAAKRGRLAATQAFGAIADHDLPVPTVEDHRTSFYPNTTGPRPLGAGGFRCAADEPPPGTARGPRLHRSVDGRLMILEVPGTRQHYDAVESCDRSRAGGYMDWTLMSKDTLASVKDTIDLAAIPYWLGDRPEQRKNSQYDPELKETVLSNDSRDTARAICVQRISP